MQSIIILAFAISFIQVTEQTRHDEFKEDISVKSGHLLQGQNSKLKDYNRIELDEPFVNVVDDKDKTKLSNVKVSVDGEVVYANNPYRTTTRPKRTYKTTRKPIETIYDGQIFPEDTNDNKKKCKPSCKDQNCKKCKRVNKCKDSNGRPCKIPACDGSLGRPCRDSISRPCKGSYDKPCKDSFSRPCKNSHGKPCQERTTWSNIWNSIVGNQIEDINESFCKQCERGFLFGDSLNILGLKDSLCSICEPVTCTDYYGHKYKCRNNKVRKIVKSNGDVSISVGSSFFDTYSKLRAAIADPNALPKDFHF